jgi:hypothetical protein
MKAISKIALFCVSLSTVSSLWAYEYNISNQTGRNLVVRIRPWGVSKDFYQLVPIDGEIKQVWEGAEGGHCVGSLEWAEPSESNFAALEKKYADPKTGRIPHEKQREFGDNWRTAMMRLPILMASNEGFKAISKSAESLAKGADQLICSIMELAGTAAFPEVAGGKKVFDSLFGGAKKDDKGAPTPPTKTEEKAPDRPSTPAPTTKPAETAPDRPSTPAPTTKPGADATLSLPMGDFTILAKESADKKCKIGLAKIIKASAKLAGASLCKTRTFVIMPDIDENGDDVMNKQVRPIKPVLNAITAIGE